MATFSFSRTMWVLAIVFLLLAAIGTSQISAAIIPNNLFWPTDPGAGIVLRHGDTWYFGKGCDGQWKRHVGVDISVGSGRPVYATESGRVVVVGYDSKWAYWITLEHTDCQCRPYTSNYFHVNPLVKNGDCVCRGQKIGTIYNLGSNSHLHFGIRNAPYSNVSNRGALPATKSCGPDDPKWPEYTVDPLKYAIPACQPAPSLKTEHNTATTWGTLKKS